MSTNTPNLSLVPPQAAEPPRKVVNVTYMGRSAEISFPYEGNPSNEDLLSIAEETLRSNPPPSFADLTIARGALRGYTVDPNSGTGVVFIRPAATFG